MSLARLKALAVVAVVCCISMGCMGTGGAGSPPKPYVSFSGPREPYVSFELLGLVETSDGLSASVRLTPHGVPKDTRVSQTRLGEAIEHNLRMGTEWGQNIVIAVPALEIMPLSPDEDFIILSAPYTEVRVDLDHHSAVGILEVDPPRLDTLPAGTRVFYGLMGEILATHGDRLLDNIFIMDLRGASEFVFERQDK